MNRRKAEKKSIVYEQTDNSLTDVTNRDLTSSNATTKVHNSMVQGYSQDVIVTIECNCDNHHCVSENIITSLKLEVKELNDKVKILMQVDTLTTALGLASNCTPTSTSASASIQSSSSQACIDAHTQECTNTDRPMFSITSEPRWSYAAVIGNRSGVQQMHQRIHQKMVSAVYIDLEKRK